MPNALHLYTAGAALFQASAGLLSAVMALLSDYQVWKRGNRRMKAAPVELLDISAKAE
jgi:hypothetical protein